MARAVSVLEVAQHNKVDDVWIVVDGKVYDMTHFAPEHPGGSEIIYRYAGRDASSEYNEVHAPTLIQKALEQEKHIGILDESTITEGWKSLSTATKAGDSVDPNEKPSLDDIINLYDFEQVASRTLSKKGWAYISAGSNDNITRDANNAMLKRIWFRPAVMRNVGTVSMRTKLFGCHLELPIYISPAGAGMAAGPEGELALAKGAGVTGIIQCIATPASYPYEEILDATSQHAFFQLYVNKEREKSEAAVRQVTDSGKVKAIFVTVDLPVVSKREADERIKPDKPIESTNVSLAASGRDRKGAGLARRNGSFIDPTFNWDDLRWLRSITHLPIIVKGIQRSEDAKIAMQLGCQGIVLSNHGGRAADNALPAILTLLELHKHCPEVFGAMEILVDGGFRRGSDVVKAICLGASAVGFGRSFMYALNYGRDGVEHAVEIIKDEIDTAMRLCGMTDLMRDANPDYVNTADIDHLVSETRHPYARKMTKVKERL